MAIEALSSLHTDRLALHYRDTGPERGPVAVLLHGWPDDIATWDALRRALNAAGWRTLVPYLRGFGPNRFLDPDTPRSGQLSAVAADALALPDRLGIQRFAVIGHDWGARAAYILAALHPDRVSHCVALSVGYTPPGAPPLRQAENYWYQWYFHTASGQAALERDRRALCRYLWQRWAPEWRDRETAFETAATAFDNPDWLAITLHSYQQRWGHVEGDPAYRHWEAQLAGFPAITVPSLVIHGRHDSCNDPTTSENRDGFHGHYRRALLAAGHFPHREQPGAVNQLVTEWLGATATETR